MTETDALMDRLDADDTICAGQVCVKGTRIPVSLILDALAGGDTVWLPDHHPRRHCRRPRLRRSSRPGTHPAPGALLFVNIKLDEKVHGDVRGEQRPLHRLRRSGRIRFLIGTGPKGVRPTEDACTACAGVALPYQGEDQRVPRPGP